MTNKDIIQIFEKNFSLVQIVGKPLLKIKEEDFKAQIKNLLAYMDCDAYDEQVRKGFRIFANRLIEILEYDDKGTEAKV